MTKPKVYDPTPNPGNGPVLYPHGSQVRSVYLVHTENNYIEAGYTWMIEQRPLADATIAYPPSPASFVFFVKAGIPQFHDIRNDSNGNLIHCEAASEAHRGLDRPMAYQ